LKREGPYELSGENRNYSCVSYCHHVF